MTQKDKQQIEDKLYKFFAFTQVGSEIWENINIRMDKDLEEFEIEFAEEDKNTSTK